MTDCPKQKTDYCRDLDKVVTPDFCKIICKKGRMASSFRRMANRQFPPVSTMAGSFVKESVKYVMEGRPKRTEEEIQNIITICRVCPFFTEVTGKMQCEKCGCFLQAKIKWQTAHCPLKKW